MDLLGLLACLEQRVPRELWELMGQMVKQDPQGQMDLLEREAHLDYQDPQVYQDREVHKGHKEKEVTAALLETWESRDQQVFKDLLDHSGHEGREAKVDLEVLKVLLALAEELATRGLQDMLVPSEFQV